MTVPRSLYDLESQVSSHQSQDNMISSMMKVGNADLAI